MTIWFAEPPARLHRALDVGDVGYAVDGSTWIREPEGYRAYPHALAAPPISPLSPSEFNDAARENWAKRWRTETLEIINGNCAPRTPPGWAWWAADGSPTEWPAPESYTLAAEPDTHAEWIAMNDTPIPPVVKEVIDAIVGPEIVVHGPDRVTIAGVTWIGDTDPGFAPAAVDRKSLGSSVTSVGVSAVGQPYPATPTAKEIADV